MKEKSNVKDKLNRFFGGGGSNDEDDEKLEDDNYYTTSKEDYHEQNGIAGSKMMLLEPRAYSESQQIADYLKNRNAVVVNLKRVTPDQAKRIVDFLYGTIYAIGGDIQKLGGGIFLCTPNNVKVDGKITDDNNPSKTSHGKKEESEGKDNDSDDDFF
ncbi:MAG: cell division protein SepF [Bacilli bacterium]|nr:cell division protein SepF [Bacilli bacterium]